MSSSRTRTSRTPTTPPADGTYRGRRRLPKLPGPRYFRVVATALVCALFVALGTAVAFPDHRADAEPPASALLDRLSAANEEKRADLLRGSAEIILDPNAPDVWVLPLKYKYQITTYYTMRCMLGTCAFHWGVDLAAPQGTPMYAVHSGIVRTSGWVSGYGNCTMIDHGNGVLTVYGHAYRLETTVGQVVTAGQEIALVGNTGNSYGDHLHFEVRVNFDATKHTYTETDPIPFMRARGVDIANRTDDANGGVVG